MYGSIIFGSMDLNITYYYNGYPYVLDLSMGFYKNDGGMIRSVISQPCLMAPEGI